TSRMASSALFSEVLALRGSTFPRVCSAAVINISMHAMENVRRPALHIFWDVSLVNWANRITNNLFAPHHSARKVACPLHKLSTFLYTFAYTGANRRTSKRVKAGRK